jgi:hypothetical protein
MFPIREPLSNIENRMLKNTIIPKLKSDLMKRKIALQTPAPRYDKLRDIIAIEISNLAAATKANAIVTEIQDEIISLRKYIADLDSTFTQSQSSASNKKTLVESPLRKDESIQNQADVESIFNDNDTNGILTWCGESHEKNNQSIIASSESMLSSEPTPITFPSEPKPFIRRSNRRASMSACSILRNLEEDISSREKKVYDPHQKKVDLRKGHTDANTDSIRDESEVVSNRQNKSPKKHMSATPSQSNISPRLLSSDQQYELPILSYGNSETTVMDECDAPLQSHDGLLSYNMNKFVSENTTKIRALSISGVDVSVSAEADKLQIEDCVVNNYLDNDVVDLEEEVDCGVLMYDSVPSENSEPINSSSSNGIRRAQESPKFPLNRLEIPESQGAFPIANVKEGYKTNTAEKFSTSDGKTKLIRSRAKPNRFRDDDISSQQKIKSHENFAVISSDNITSGKESSTDFTTSKARQVRTKREKKKTIISDIVSANLSSAVIVSTNMLLSPKAKIESAVTVKLLRREEEAIPQKSKDRDSFRCDPGEEYMDEDSNTSGANPNPYDNPSPS